MDKKIKFLPPNILSSPKICPEKQHGKNRKRLSRHKRHVFLKTDLLLRISSHYPSFILSSLWP